MKRYIKTVSAFAGLLAAAFSATPARFFAQAEPAPSSASVPQDTVTRSVRIMDFSNLSGPTTVVFRFTPLVSGASGQAEIEPVRSVMRIHANFSNLAPAATLGAPYLTYTLWSVTPEGRITNLGEIELTGAAGALKTKCKAQKFGLIVTAEPYFAVSQPNSAVAFEADVAPNSPVNIPVTQAKCELLRAPLGSELVAGAAPNPKTSSDPLVFEEARRAIAVARAAGAAEYAPQTFSTAEQLLKLAQRQLAQAAKHQDVLDTGVEAVLVAEDARVLAVARQRRAHQAPVAQDPTP